MDATGVHGRLRVHITGRMFVVLVALCVIFLFALWRAWDVYSQPPVIAIGEEEEVGSFVYSVLSVESRVVIEDGVLARRAEGVYKIVKITVRNEDDRRHNVNEELFSVIDAAGTEYLPVCRADIGSCVEELPQTFTQRIVDPGEEILGIFIFDVDTDASGFKLKIIRDAFVGDHVLFDLD